MHVASRSPVQCSRVVRLQMVDLSLHQLAPLCCQRWLGASTAMRK